MVERVVGTQGDEDDEEEEEEEDDDNVCGCILVARGGLLALLVLVGAAGDIMDCVKPAN